MTALRTQLDRSFPARAPRPTPGARATRGPERAPRVWGLDAAGLHDRVWAARCVQVVRPGGDRVENGAGLYLLLQPGVMLDFRLRPLLRSLHWDRPRAVRLRVLNQRQQPYEERVMADAEGNFLRIERVYRPAARGSARAWLTDDAAIARAWRAAGDGARRLPWRALRAVVEPEETLSTQVPGEVLDPQRGAVERLAEIIARDTLDLAPAIAGVYRYQPGVWVHETSQIDPSARFVGPAFVGAGRSVGADPLVIGPAALPDEPGVRAAEAASGIDWASLRSSGGRLLPRVGRRWWRRASKRAFDVAVSGAALLAVAPLFPVLMLVIYLEDGRPFFFAHTRQTIGGRDFPCFKFRTMVNGAEAMKAQLAAQNGADGPQFFIRDDPRLLRCGRWMRRFQLDELPQLWNILVGHMSVVGPRPSPDKENQYCPSWREARLSIRPGLTGLWQVRRTREPLTDFQEWIRYDLEYVQRESWALDLWIMFETARQIVVGSGGRERKGKGRNG